MQYALLVYTKPDLMDNLGPEELSSLSAEYWAIRDIPGVYDGAHLAPVESATTIRADSTGTLSTDGPFADTKEVFAGYYLFEGDDIDAALEVAARIPAVRLGGAIEVRPIIGETS